MDQFPPPFYTARDAGQYQTVINGGIEANGFRGCLKRDLK